MALASKLLEEKVVNLSKEMLKKVSNKAYVAKKTKCSDSSKIKKNKKSLKKISTRLYKKSEEGGFFFDELRFGTH